MIKPLIILFLVSATLASSKIDASGGAGGSCTATNGSSCKGGDGANGGTASQSNNLEASVPLHLGLAGKKNRRV